MVEIRLANKDDFDFIYKLWCRNSKTLGRCFKSSIQEMIDKGQMLIIDNVGFCGNIVMKRKPVVKLDGLCIVESERNKGYGKMFINYISEKYHKPIILEAVKDAENNHFYDKLGSKYDERTSKYGKMILYKYVLNEKDLDYKDKEELF